MKLSKQALIALGITGAGVLGCSRTELTREQLDKMLMETAKKPVTSALSDGAPCYSMMVPVGSIEYLCPVCKTKTHHAKRKNKEDVINASWYREKMKRIQKLGLNATLDETDLCSQCRQDKTTDTVDFYILVTADKRSVRTRLNFSELDMLIAFLEKKDVWKTENDIIRPLKGKLPRLFEILGMDTDGILFRFEEKTGNWILETKN